MRCVPSLLCYLWLFLLPVLIMAGVIASANYLVSYGLAVSWVIGLFLGIALTPEEADSWPC